MAEYLIQSETLDDIADAINAKTGGSSAMTPAEMVTEIGSIQTGGGLDVARLAPGTYTGCTVDGDGRITASGNVSATFQLTKPLQITEGDVISIAIMNTVRAYHIWELYNGNTLLQQTQTANYNTPYVTSITATFTGEVDGLYLRINPSATGVTNMKFAFFLNGKPILV